MTRQTSLYLVTPSWIIVHVLIRMSAIPHSVETTVARGHYVSYSSMVSGSNSMASDATFTFTAEELALSKPNRQADLEITFAQWTGARTAVVSVTKCLRPNAVERLEIHNANIEHVHRTLGWEIAVRYDRHERETLASDPCMDIAPLNNDTVQMITNQIMMAWLTTITQPIASHSGAGQKRPAPSASGGGGKRARTTIGIGAGPSGHCFRCGRSGCRPSTCSATSTVSGHACAPLDTTGKSPDALIGPNGKPFCLSFAIGRCTSTNCLRHHTCSICTGAHGAGSCPH
jgi:hypothetical protein